MQDFHAVDDIIDTGHAKPDASGLIFHVHSEGQPVEVSRTLTPRATIAGTRFYHKDTTSGHCFSEFPSAIAGPYVFSAPTLFATLFALVNTFCGLHPTVPKNLKFAPIHFSRRVNSALPTRPAFSETRRSIARLLMDGWRSADIGDPDDHDIATTHDDNSKLKERDEVKRFFEEAREHKSLAELGTREWIGCLPLDMSQEAIPLFVDVDSSTDYQLHPHYTTLELRNAVLQPHPEIFRLSIDGTTLKDPNLVCGIGRLFVNSDNAETGRTSRWTGYEVFVDNNLALWMVFDRSSITLSKTGTQSAADCQT